ncbi:hypothetical protein EXIGLDRAFT_778641 [Exidia glandulosa HHB12029]|uniref:BTB domain-containing protein n=1 Tax=Exidia glandulosa HHB12029 TaxID=1314781 RepID=A0A165CG86_EXIGL|nr:hypothetical protein EXIGLDRAFT_778641 [Exidia glandulosa HHB12029]
MSDKFNVALRGRTFTLYREQIEYDAPNYFTELFLGEFSEAKTRHVELSRNDDLFSIIVDYMSGYTVTPLSEAVVPPTMTLETAHTNLLRDAEFYGLQGLVELLQSGAARDRLPVSACVAFGIDRDPIRFADILRGPLMDGIVFDERGVGTLCDGE